MERGARREEARGLRARAAAAPRDPQPASAGARTGTRAADTRARAAPAPPAGSGARPGAEAPLAAPPQSSRSARPSRRLGSSDSSRPAPRRSGERRIVLRRLGRGSGGRRGKKSWGRGGRRSPGGKAEDTSTLRPLLTATGRRGRTGRGSPSRGAALPRTDRRLLGAQLRPGGKGDLGEVERRSAAEALSLPASERAPVGEEGGGPAASSPHRRPPTRLTRAA